MSLIEDIIHETLGVSYKSIRYVVDQSEKEGISLGECLERIIRRDYEGVYIACSRGEEYEPCGSIKEAQDFIRDDCLYDDEWSLDTESSYIARIVQRVRLVTIDSKQQHHCPMGREYCDEDCGNICLLHNPYSGFSNQDELCDIKYTKKK